MAAFEKLQFLFDPAAVREHLGDLQSLAAELRPETEGVEAETFEEVRKSERQLYRILGNTHYDHLADLLKAFDRCMECGYRQPRLLRTRVRSSFAADVAELR